MCLSVQTVPFGEQKRKTFKLLSLSSLFFWRGFFCFSNRSISILVFIFNFYTSNRYVLVRLDFSAKKKKNHCYCQCQSANGVCVSVWETSHHNKNNVRFLCVNAFIYDNINIHYSRLDIQEFND